MTHLDALFGPEQRQPPGRCGWCDNPTDGHGLCDYHRDRYGPDNRCLHVSTNWAYCSKEAGPDGYCDVHRNSGTGQ